MKVDSPRFAAIAMKVKVKACVLVKKATVDRITQFLVVKQDQFKHKEFCIEEFNTNQVETERFRSIMEPVETCATVALTTATCMRCSS